MILLLYRFLTDAGAWPLRALLRLRSWRGKEDPARLAERRGLTQLPRPSGHLIWCHAVSVGESLALLSLIKRFCSSPDTHVLLTTGTLSSARLMSDRLPAGALHQFAPWDRRGWVSRFLDHWQPDLAIRMESEIWPNTMRALKDRQIPIAVINARLSDRSMRNWARFPSTARAVFGNIDLTLAQTGTFADRFRGLGARHVDVAANLKLAAEPLGADTNDLAALREQIGTRPVWLAASTHEGEERIALAVHRALSAELPDLLTIIVPRHPGRATEILQFGVELGVTMCQRSRNDSAKIEADVYLADTFGELGLFFRVSPVVFMGKSLTAVGGQNPIEPAHFDCAILFGTHMENFEDIAKTMAGDNMAVQIESGEALEEAVRSFLSDEPRRRSYSTAADALIRHGTEGLEKTHTALQTLLSNSAHNGL